MSNLKRYQMTIAGKKVDPASGEWFETANPYTGKAWAEIPRGNAEDIDRAVKAAKAAAAVWRKTTPTQRGHLMRRLADLMAERKSWTTAS